MKQEILYVENLTTALTSVQNLDHVSFSLEPGEILGITGLSSSGISILADALTGGVHPVGGAMYLDGKAVSPASQEEANRLGLYEINHSLSVIRSLSVSENLNVLRRFVWRDFFVKQERNRQITQMVFRQYHIGGDPCASVQLLTTGQRMELAICRALLCGARVLVCREAGEGFNEEELYEFEHFIHQLRNEGIPMIMLNSDVRMVMRLADRVAVMRRGMICYSRKTEEASLQDIYRCMGLSRSEDSPAGAQGPKTPYISLRHIRNPGGEARPLSADLYSGEILGACWEGCVYSDASVRLYRGDFKGEGTVIQDGRSIRFQTWRKAHRHQILCFGMGFWEQGIYENLTAGENLLFRTYHRYDRRAGLFNLAMLRLALREFCESHQIDPDCLHQYPRHLSPGLRNQLVLWTALLAPPKLLVLDNPLYAIDEQVRRNFLACLAELKAAGTSVLWNSNSLLGLGPYCDRIITIPKQEL